MLIKPRLTLNLCEGGDEGYFLLNGSSVTTQAQGTIVKGRAMTAQDNLDVAPRSHQQFNTMDSCLIDYIGIHPPIFYGPKVDEDPHEFLDEV